MALPGVNIEILNNQLGSTPGTDDGVAGLIMSGVEVAGKIALSEPKQIFSTDDAKELGLDAAYDTDNSVEVWKHISEFYAQAGEGSELWIMLVVNTTTMEDICDQTNDLAKKLLDAANGRIRLLGVTRIPDGTYTPTFNDGLDDDVTAAVLTAQALATAYAALYKPVRILLEGRAYQGVVANLADLRAGSENRVGVVLGGTKESATSAAVGLTLGRLAKNPVQRNIGRVKDGNLGIVAAYLSDGNPIEDLSEAEWGQVHDKGYIFMRPYQGKNGYYFNDDPSCSPITDDYSSLARGRVIDKALLLTYATYIEEILDDIEVDPDTGRMNAAVIKNYQSLIENTLNTQMTNEGEVSGVTVNIDPTQNVLSTDKVVIDLRIIPLAYGKTIEVSLGFSNPANS